MHAGPAVLVNVAIELYQAFTPNGALPSATVDWRWRSGTVPLRVWLGYRQPVTRGEVRGLWERRCERASPPPTPSIAIAKPPAGGARH